MEFWGNPQAVEKYEGSPRPYLSTSAPSDDYNLYMNQSEAT
jgi:hypothetical protein